MGKMHTTKFTGRWIQILSLALFLSATNLYAQKIIPASDQEAGFRVSTEALQAQPVIHYWRDVQMLSGIDDKPAIRVYGDGRVRVHYPSYMKRAGDYEMQLNDAELTALLRSLSSDGLMEMDEKKIKTKKKALKQSLRQAGQFYEVSDAVVTVVDIQLDEYQKNAKAKKIKKFTARLKWKNLEQDAKRYKSDPEVTRIDHSVSKLKALMEDRRLLKKEAK